MAKDKTERGLKQRPFLREDREQALKDIESKFDDKRTLCNVIKMIYNFSDKRDGDFDAIRELALEAMWMGKRMTNKLTRYRQIQMCDEYIDQKDSYLNFNHDSYPARGNWD